MNRVIKMTEEEVIQPVIQISVMEDANRISPRWQLIAIGD